VIAVRRLIRIKENIGIISHSQRVKAYIEAEARLRASKVRCVNKKTNVKRY